MSGQEEMQKNNAKPIALIGAMKRIVVCPLLFFLLLFASLTGQAEEKLKRQKYPKGSPEAVVEALMYYDFTNRLRGEDTLENPYLALAPELVGPFDPLSKCGYVMAFVDSFRIAGGKPAGLDAEGRPAEYYVTVEAFVRGVEVYSDLVEMLYKSDKLMEQSLGAESGYFVSAKKIKCGWLDLEVLNRRTGFADGTYRDSIDGPAALLNVLERIGHPVEADMGSKRYLIDSDRRLWRFKVALTRDSAAKRWILKMPVIPYHIALSARKAVWQEIVRMSNDEVEYCAGRQPRPKWWTGEKCDQKELEKELKSGQLGMDFIHQMEKN